ncbi:glycine cleavage system protein GcvH [Neptunomonas phycophila]|jgi:glycine cleavage system H protein|uniref:Glycine cleavage system H protein n=2 Tax=Neptunomonas phycophila TaxID=1572645 RepID=A0AAW7XK70_9GAMM|nr:MULTISPECIES: glycine cleavage system protein GcvH [Neptunomonas]MBT3145707.1 glycine cleavage system protein GcvH [Neptunomonas phycophila]MDN2660200.1 glycine cleavage system protein GcvH [Neptunomonas sp. CHC150]MDO6453225.1 glycine cleavage system protein GcvH [Neptunomonas phycophila]MDO6469334.1 glycine cleavage system protein GcvH [Neptunomonas phycophila]MDO6784332.1 glycine cleavage system protein GcvH [Neptunomonas phycophila]
MSDIRNELKYVSSHEWIRDEGDGTVTIGITDHAQDLLGDVVFVELPEEGSEVGAGDDAGVVESVKAASDIYAPVSGEVVAVNEQLEESPELVNSDPYGDGWFFRLKLSDASELDDLLDAAAYGELCEDEE